MLSGGALVTQAGGWEVAACAGEAFHDKAVRRQKSSQGSFLSEGWGSTKLAAFMWLKSGI